LRNTLGWVFLLIMLLHEIRLSLRVMIYIIYNEIEYRFTIVPEWIPPIFPANYADSSKQSEFSVFKMTPKNTYCCILKLHYHNSFFLTRAAKWRFSTRKWQIVEEYVVGFIKDHLCYGLPLICGDVATRNTSFNMCYDI